MTRMVAQGVYNDFLMEYMDRYRTSLDEHYPTYEAFAEGFTLSDDDLGLLIHAAKERKVEYNEEDWTLSKELIRTQLTAMIAQRLFSTTEFYRVMNPRENEPYKKALEILHAWNEQGEQILLGQ